MGERGTEIEFFKDGELMPERASSPEVPLTQSDLGSCFQARQRRPGGWSSQLSNEICLVAEKDSIEILAGSQHFQPESSTTSVVTKHGRPHFEHWGKPGERIVFICAPERGDTLHPLSMATHLGLSIRISPPQPSG